LKIRQHHPFFEFETLNLGDNQFVYKGSHPLLSCADIISLLCNFLPERSITSEEVLRQLEVLHQKRIDSVKSANRKQRRKSIF